MGDAKRKKDGAEKIKTLLASEQERFYLLMWLNLVCNTENHLERRKMNRLFDALELDDVEARTTKPVPLDSLGTDGEPYELSGDQIDYMLRELDKPAPKGQAGQTVGISVQRVIGRLSDRLKALSEAPALTAVADEEA